MMLASSSDNASGQLLARLLARRLTRPVAAPVPPALPRPLDAGLPLAYSVCVAEWAQGRPGKTQNPASGAPLSPFNLGAT